MKTTPITYPSTDGASTIRAWLWEPDGRADVRTGSSAPGTDSANRTAATPPARPRGLVQIVHGMSEHMGRYRQFIEFLCAQGFAVCGNDHVGHGRTAESSAELGHMPRRGGEDILVENVQILRLQALARLGMDTPYVIFGHSMGSFIARIYLTRYAYGVRAAIICGTGQQPRALTGAGQAFCGLVSVVRGERHHSKIAHALGAGAFGRAIPDARTPMDWISTDPAVVDDYLADLRAGQMFTVGAYATLAALTADAQSKRLARRIPRGLPMLFVSGAEDPVGERGRGVERAVAQYRSVGMERVEQIIYPGARHEILHEPICATVEADLLGWMERQGL